MSDFIYNEMDRLKREKSVLLTKLGQSIYYQYRIGQLYSDELRDFGEQIAELDQRIHQFYSKLVGEENPYKIRCVCGNIVDKEDTYCSKCGSEVETIEEEEKTRCHSCEAEVIMQAKFCHVCGSRQEQKLGVSP